jgi:predicted acyl esterase
VTFTVHKDVMVAMRDGVELATDLWLPDTAPAPTLLVRLPYSKDLPGLLGYGLVPNLFALVETEPIEVTGHVSLTVFASSSAPDTDFTGKLVDVFPDGRAIFLTDGILRARYRNSLAQPSRSRLASPTSSAWTCRSRPTSSGPATGSGSRCPAATSRATTATATPAA